MNGGVTSEIDTPCLSTFALVAAPGASGYDPAGPGCVPAYPSPGVFKVLPGVPE